LKTKNGENGFKRECTWQQRFDNNICGKNVKPEKTNDNKIEKNLKEQEKYDQTITNKNIKEEREWKRDGNNILHLKFANINILFADNLYPTINHINRFSIGNIIIQQQNLFNPIDDINNNLNVNRINKIHLSKTRK